MGVTRLTSDDSGGTNTAIVETSEYGSHTVLRSDLVDYTDYLNEAIVERPTGFVNGLTANIENTDDVSFVYRPESQQTTYYISPSGNDSNDGLSSGNPWLTWTHAVGVVVAGDVVLLMTGTHSSLFSGLPSHHPMYFNGTANKPITVKAQPGASPVLDWVTLQGSWGIFEGIEANYIFSYVEYMTVKDCVFHTTSTIYNIFTIHENHGWIKIIDCEFYDQPNRSAIDNVGSQECLIQGCYIHDCFRAIHMKGGSFDLVVENNLIIDIGDSAFVGSGISLITCYNFHGNTDQESLAVADRYHADELIMRNNVVVNCASWGAVRIGGWRNYKIYNNTFYNMTGSYVLVVDSQPFEFVDAIALAYTPYNTCNSPCTDTNQCRRLDIYSGDGEIKNNIFKDIPVLLRVYSSNPIPDMDYNIIDDSNYTDPNTPSNAYVIYGSNRTLAYVRSNYGIEVNTTLQSVTLDSGDDYSGGPSTGGASLSEVVFDYDWARRVTDGIGAH